MNVYSEDPNNPMVKPWHIPPSSCTQDIVKVDTEQTVIKNVVSPQFQWSLPLPTDMSDPRDALVMRAIYIRCFMERSRGDIRQWSWIWEKEIQNIDVRTRNNHYRELTLTFGCC